MNNVATIEDNDVFELFFKLLNGVGFYWNFYVVGVLAIIGWILSADSPPATEIRAVVTGGFVFFIAYNLFALRWRYEWLDLITSELKQRVSPCIFKEQALCDRVEKLSFGFSNHYALGIHAMVDVALVCLVWSDAIWTI